MARWWKQALTFGAEGRVEKAWHEYEGVVLEARALALQVEQRRLAANAVLNQLVAVKIASLPSLRKIQEIARNLGARERIFAPEVAGEQTPEVALARIEGTLTAGATALAGAKGISAGASTAFGAWALAQAYAAASTGAAISGLSGAAASSATLAWFGGGPLAAGGLGIAGGGVVLGGIVALPSLGIMAVLAHTKANRKIAEIEAESGKLEQAMDDMRKLELVVALAEQRANELMAVIGRAKEAYEHEYTSTYQRLFPWRWFSKARRWIRKWLFERTQSRIGGPYFREHEVQEVGKLLEVAAEFAGILDQRVFEENGSLREGAT